MAYTEDQLDFCGVAGCISGGIFRSVNTRISYCRDHGRHLNIECASTGRPIMKPAERVVPGAAMIHSNPNRVRGFLEGSESMANTPTLKDDQLTMSRIREASAKLKEGKNVKLFAKLYERGGVEIPWIRIPGKGMLEVNFEDGRVRVVGFSHTFMMRRNAAGLWEHTQDIYDYWIRLPDQKAIDDADLMWRKGERPQTKTERLITPPENEFDITTFPGDACEECAEKPARPGENQRFCSDPCWLKGAERAHKHIDPFEHNEILQMFNGCWRASAQLRYVPDVTKPAPLSCEGTHPEDLV